MITVQKFGGTSVADPERIREVAEHAVRTKRRGTDVVLVVSAMGKETDALLRLADDVSTSQPGREMDMLITAGERKAMALVAMAISDLGEPILARWRHGAGWSVAWTSDVKNRWAVDWIRWNGYPKFWGQMVRTTMRRHCPSRRGLRDE